MPKVYSGKRTPTGCVVTVDDGKTVKDLDPRLDLVNHSPTGFEFGYTGSGPAQLSLALLADCFGNDDDRALELHQWFKNEWVAAQSRDWQITSNEILCIVSRY
jgi:hypothetical protein